MIRNLESVAQLTDCGNAEILAIGHGDPITEGAARRIPGLVG